MSTDWFHDSIIYQIFPERFAVGHGRTARDKQKLGFYRGEQDWISEWNELPRKGPGQNRQFFGGDLAGIRERLDYLQDLGVDLIYLTPFYASPSNHRYDTIDYFTIDPATGDPQGFAALVDDIHARGMRIIIDIALNHISDQHPLFREACQNSESKYREYFRFIEYPHRYICWYGFDGMPELNFANPAVVEDFIIGANSVLRFWLDRGVDGFRLDTANDLGMPLMGLIQRTVHSINPQAIVVGEVSQFPGDWTRVMDGVQSYYYRNSVLSFISGDIDIRAFSAALADITERLSLPEQLGLLNQIGSHDAPRIATILQKRPKLMPFFVAMMFAFPGVPMLYYGEENGMQGGRDPENRAPMVWDESRWNSDMRALISRWIELRGERRELRRGSTQLLTDRCQDAIAFVRSTDHPDEYSLAVLNPDSRKKTVKLLLPFPHVHSQLVLQDAFGSGRFEALGGAVRVELQPCQAILLLPDMATKPNYRFSKSWHVSLDS